MAKREKKEKVIRTNDLPSSPADKLKLLKMVREAADSRTKLAAQRDQLKEVKATILEEFPITKKLLKELINFEFNSNFDEVTGEWNEIQHAYEKLIEAQEKKKGD